MQVPIEEIIKKSLGSGFDSELKVASSLVSSGWAATQNIYYIDKDERKGRELDIVAHRAFSDYSLTPKINMWIYLCIEVKKSKEPEIFFSNYAGRFEPGRAYGLLHWKHRINNSILHWKEIEECKPLGDQKRIARSYMSFKDQGTQKLKSGILSAFKGAIYMAENCEERYDESSHDLCFFMPLVVIDGSIAECYFDKLDGNLIGRYVDNIAYAQNYRSESYGEVRGNVIVTNIINLSNLLGKFEVWGRSMLTSMVARHGQFESR